LEPLGRPAISALQLSVGDRVLDIGCGIGTTPFTLAQVVGPTGRVVGIDLLKGALDVASADPGLPPNVSLVHGDAQSHPFEDRSFDGVFSRFGIMFFADPVAAFKNIRRALRPGGRLAFVCWRGLEENELDALPLRAASAVLPAGLAAEAASSGPFSFARAESIHDVLAEAGFAEAEVAPRDEQVESGSLQAMVDVCSRVGALGKILRDHPEFRPDAVAALEEVLRARDGARGPALRAATWVACACA
jgi:ubiquinone/menaquinone biosynthesis C-methylase UbiE